MKAVAYRLRCALRERWLSTVGLCVLTTAVIGVVLAFAAGAQRTSSVADRYTSSRPEPFDGVIYQLEGHPRTAEIGALPGTASVDSVTFVFGALFRPGDEEDLGATVFAGSYVATGARLVSGRLPSPKAPGEFVATPSLIEDKHLSFGDSFVLRTLDQEQADEQGFETSEEPAGPTVTAVLVGEVDGPANLDDPTPAAVFSPALLDDPGVGVKVTIMSVGLEPGVDLDAFRTQLDTLPGSESLSLEQGVLVSPALRRAARAQSLGLWALAAVAGVASVAVLGQLITRQVKLSDGDRSRLSALGYVERQVVSESIGRAALPIIVGAVAGIAVATALSNRFPTGFARRLEPDQGARFEAAVLLLGAAAFVVALLAWTASAVALSKLAARHGTRRAMAIETIATRLRSAKASTGLRFAFGRRPQDRGSTRTVAAGLALTVACLVGALTFATSLVRLVEQPARYGVNYDFLVGGSGAESLPEGIDDTLGSSDDVVALTGYGEGQARVGAATFRLIGMEPMKGDLGPPVLSGRLPVGTDEIALGRLAASSLHTKVGGDVSLDGDSGAEVFHVTGLVVVPSLGLNEGVGQDGVVTLEGLARLVPGTTVTSIAVGLRNADDASLRRLATLTGFADATLLSEDDAAGTPPAAIVNIDRIRSIPFVLAGLLTVLVALTLVHAMVTSVQNRRRDIAVLRSMGADRRFIRRAVLWQATAFTVVPIAVGAPVGIVIGRLVFRVFADSMGAIDDASIPLLLLLAGAVAVVILADLAASIARRGADHGLPALLLRSE